MPDENPIRTVVLTVAYSTRSSYYRDWLDAFEQSRHFAVTAFNLFRRAERRAASRALVEAEFTVALHSCSADTMAFLRPLESALQARNGRFLMLVGNEYNLPWAPISEKRGFLRRVGADFVGTQLPLETAAWLYEGTGAVPLAMPHALNDAVFRRERPDPARRVDIGGRSARYPVYVGDDERNRLYAEVSRFAAAAGLSIDIGTGERLERDGWAAFLGDCRGTIGSEAGSWYLERDDHTVFAIREFLKTNGRAAIRADGWLHGATRHLPYRTKERLRAALKWLPIGHEALGNSSTIEAEIFERFFAGREPAAHYSKCISSRHFDAAGTGTCQILIRGRYNDILSADEHYIPLAPDLSDLGTAIERFRDPRERRRIADAAYALAHDRHTYRHRIGDLHRLLSAA